MADVVYFSGELTATGEQKLIKHQEHIDFDPAPMRIEVVVHDVEHSDPTLSVFYEPVTLHEDDEHAVG